ncbi:MAG: fatty acid desaturase [Acidimicrobiia bacterium]
MTPVAAPHGASTAPADDLSVPGTTAAAGLAARTETTLEPVRAIIPAKCYERSTIRGLAHVGLAVVIYALLIWGLAITDNPFAVVGLWLVSFMSLSSLFVLGHDAAHGALFDSKRMNGIIGRGLMLPTMHVYEAWVLGHNRIHHGHTVRQGMDFVWHPVTAEEYRAFNRYQRLQHRVEWSFLGAGAYYMRNVWWHKMMRFDPPEKFAKAIRKDWWLVMVGGSIVVAAAGAYGWSHYGTVLGVIWTIVKLVVIPTLGFMQVIGWTVHVHHVSPEIRWWPRREWNKFRGQMEGTTVLRFNPVLDWLFFHHIFVHVPHHVDMRIPFYELPRAAKAIEEAYPGVIIDKKFKVRDYLHAAGTCKLYDFEVGTWLPYSAANEAPASSSTATA